MKEMDLWGPGRKQGQQPWLEAGTPDHQFHFSQEESEMSQDYLNWRMLEHPGAQPVTKWRISGLAGSFTHHKQEGGERAHCWVILSDARCQLINTAWLPVHVQSLPSCFRGCLVFLLKLRPALQMLNVSGSFLQGRWPLMTPALFLEHVCFPS